MQAHKACVLRMFVEAVVIVVAVVVEHLCEVV